jgi:hypothetical protein
MNNDERRPRTLKTNNITHNSGILWLAMLALVKNNRKSKRILRTITKTKPCMILKNN